MLSLGEFEGLLIAAGSREGRRLDTILSDLQRLGSSGVFADDVSVMEITFS
jgi:hypothetical protein